MDCFAALAMTKTGRTGMDAKSQKDLHYYEPAKGHGLKHDPFNAIVGPRPDGKEAQAWLTLGEVVAVHIDKAMIKDGVYRTGLARPIVRAGRKGDYFEIKDEDMFEMVRPD